MYRIDGLGHSGDRCHIERYMLEFPYSNPWSATNQSLINDHRYKLNYGIELDETIVLFEEKCSPELEG